MWTSYASRMLHRAAESCLTRSAVYMVHRILVRCVVTFTAISKLHRSSLVYIHAQYIYHMIVARTINQLQHSQKPQWMWFSQFLWVGCSSMNYSAQWLYQYQHKPHWMHAENFHRIEICTHFIASFKCTCTVYHSIVALLNQLQLCWSQKPCWMSGQPSPLVGRSSTRKITIIVSSTLYLTTNHPAVAS